MNDNFIHLHLHSSYSYTDGYGLPEQYIERAVEIGQKGLAVTDHGNISAHFKWYNNCNKNDIKPILGVEFYIVEKEEDIRGDRSYFHVTVLAKNLTGYRNLTKLVTKSWCEQFYYKPKITFQNLINHQEGLIVLSGCMSSPAIKNIVERNKKKTIEYIELMEKSIDDFFIEFMPISFDEGVRAYKEFLELYKERWTHIPMVATNDCHYVREGQDKVQEILLCIQTNHRMDDPDRMKFEQDDFYLKTRKEMETSLNKLYPNFDFTEALDNTVKIMDMIDFEFPIADPIKFPMKEESKIPYLKKTCEEGMIRRGLKGDGELDLQGITKEEYQERLDYEIDLIIKKDFIDYFLVVHDLVKWSKDNGILVGPARGSAAGSLTCYVMNITEVEPIRYGLIFERFIDLNREDLPDIDIDFEDVRRNEVKEYLEQKYGRNKVGNLPVFASFKGKSAIDDVGRVFKLPFPMLEKVKKAIIERSGGDSRASFTLEDTFTSDVFEYPKKAIAEYPELKYTIDLEGQIRQIGQHAAGVVISNEPITDFCALYKIKDSYVISMDYKDASMSGLLKLDLLGLNTLSVITHALKQIKERTGKDIDIYKLKFDDPKVYKGFCDGKLFGIFQFDGQAINQVCRQIMPRDFESLSAISALGRPGPLNSGSTTMYIQRRAGKQKVEYPHPVMEPFTKETYGIVVYQEQVMKTMREVGKMSWKDTSEIRKLISRSQGVEKFNTFKDKFTIGAKDNGMTDKQINEIWESICTFGSWAFNKCGTGDQILTNTDPNQFASETVTLKELYENKGYATSRWKEQPKAYKKMNTLSMDVDGKIRPGRIKDVFYKGKKEVIKIKTESGKSIKITRNHKMLSNNGFKVASKFKIGDVIAVNNGYWSRPYKSTHKNGQAWRTGRMIAGPKDKLDGRRIEVVVFRKEKQNLPCEHCEHFHTRMEVHHVTKTPPKSILEWLCPSCHKKAEYKKGRVKIWEKGFEIGYEKIISLKILRPQDVYDVEMEDSSRPTFVANEFISHNSHSISYTMISYWTMWLKIHYPLEFYSSIMALTHSNDKKKKILKEFIKEGHQVLSVDVNRSKESFTIDGDALRIGFSDIKGAGEKVASKIVNNQPYSSYTDFIKKSKTKKSAVRNLVNLGAFDSLGNTEVQTTLFGDSIYEYEKEDISFAERFDLCPWNIDFGLEKNWMPFIKKNINYFKSLPIKIEELKEMEGSDDVIVYGIVYDKNLRDAREVSMTKGKNYDVNKYKIVHLLNKNIIKYFKGNAWISKWVLENYKNKVTRNIEEGKDYTIEEQYQFANFIVEDDTDFITVRLSHIAFPTYGKMIFEDLNPEDPVIIRGKMGSGIRMLFANKIISLKEFKEKNANKE